MSIKIYNGYKLNTSCLNTIFDTLFTCKEEIKKIATEQYLKDLSYIATTFIDLKALGLSHEKFFSKDFQVPDRLSYPHMIAYNIMMEGIKKENNDPYSLPTPFTRYTANVSIFPSVSKNKTLAIFYRGEPIYEECWQKQPLVEEYGYWNNSDRPDNVSSRQWKKRYEDWEHSFEFNGGTSWTPSETSMNFNFFEPYFAKIAHFDEYNKFIPDMDSRTLRIAEVVVREEKSKEVIDMEKFSARECADLSHDVFRWMRSDEAKEIIKEKQKEFAPQLKSKLTKEDFLEDYNE
jgi:hypothetical protein